MPVTHARFFILYITTHACTLTHTSTKHWWWRRAHTKRLPALDREKNIISSEFGFCCCGRWIGFFVCVKLSCLKSVTLHYNIVVVHVYLCVHHVNWCRLNRFRKWFNADRQNDGKRTDKTDLEKSFTFRFCRAALQTSPLFYCFSLILQVAFAKRESNDP